MPFEYPEDCPKCGQPHGVEPSWDTFGLNDCPRCGAKDAIEIDWETEYFLDPVTDAEE